MSHEATNWASKVQGISPMQKLVLMLMADCHNGHTKECFPSIDTLAKDSCAGRRTVIRAIKELEVAGLISIQKQEGKANRYDLHTSATVTPVPDSHPCQSDTPPVSERHPTRATVTPEQERTGKNRNKGVKKISQEKVISMGEGISCWELWVEHRLATKKPLTEAGWHLQVENLKQFSSEEQAAAIKNSVRNGWVGLFPKKGDKPDGADVPLKMRYL